MKETESKQSFYIDRKRIAEGRDFDMADIAIIGAGSWGTALSVLLHNNGPSHYRLVGIGTGDPDAEGMS